MKRLLLAALTVLLILSACQFHPVQSEADFAAMQTATAAVPPIPTIEPQVAPPTATVELVPTVTSTPECVNAKANISASNEKIYHLPGDANYNTVKIDKDGEAIYCTEQEAIDAGFRHAQR